MELLSIVVLLFNEEETISTFYERVSLTGIGLGQSLNGERETERTVREAQDTAQNLGNSVGREEESLRDGKEILRRVRQRGAEKTGEP